VIEPGNQFWDGVHQAQLEEQTNKARTLFRLFRREFKDQGFDGVITEEVIREGKKVEEILKQIDEDEDVSVLASRMRAFMGHGGSGCSYEGFLSRAHGAGIVARGSVASIRGKPERAIQNTTYRSGARRATRAVAPRCAARLNRIVGHALVAAFNGDTMATRFPIPVTIVPGDSAIEDIRAGNAAVARLTDGSCVPIPVITGTPSTRCKLPLSSAMAGAT
jgi:hypothetical protein